MPSLRIFMGDVPGVRGLPIPLDVFDSELVRQRRTDVWVGDSTEVVLPGGRYAVRAYLPSGETITRTVHVVEGSTESSVNLSLSAQPLIESLAWTVITNPEVLHHREIIPDQLRSIWLRLWRRNDHGRWEIDSWPTHTPVRVEDVVQYAFEFRRGGGNQQMYLQVGGPNTAWKLIALPNDQLRVVFSASELGEREGEPLHVTVASTTQQAESLQGFLRIGAIDQARVLSEALLRDKRQNPTLAAVGAYFLLQIGDLTRLHDWTKNLANWMEWLPDGAVVYGWHLLRQDNPDHNRAKTQFLTALSRGIPIYTTGLRLLRDGLMLFDDAEESQDPAVRAALKTVLQYCSAADWTSPTTTFLGADPGTPGGMRITGRPQDSRGVVFLSDLDLTDLMWKGVLRPGAALDVVSPASGEKATVELTPEGALRPSLGLRPRPGSESDEVIDLLAVAQVTAALPGYALWFWRLIRRAFARREDEHGTLWGDHTVEFEELTDAIQDAAGSEIDPWTFIQTEEGTSLADLRSIARGEGSPSSG